MFITNDNGIYKMSVEEIVDNDYKLRENTFEVDDLIAPVIALLNNKGYKTLYCCQGHYSDYTFYCRDDKDPGDMDNWELFHRPSELLPYILFEDGNLEFDVDIKSYSDKWVVSREELFEDDDLTKPVIRTNLYCLFTEEFLNSTTTMEYNKVIMNEMDALYNWACELKDLTK